MGSWEVEGYRTSNHSVSISGLCSDAFRCVLRGRARLDAIGQGQTDRTWFGQGRTARTRFGQGRTDRTRAKSNRSDAVARGQTWSDTARPTQLDTLGRGLTRSEVVKIDRADFQTLCAGHEGAYCAHISGIRKAS